MSDRPGVAPVYTRRTPRVVAACRLRRRREREAVGRFLAEGPQAVREALASGDVLELFATESAAGRYASLVADAPRTSLVTADALADLAETVTPQGLVAVCRYRDVSLADAFARPSRLVAVLWEVGDPGNAGTVLRTADAAGASAVVFAGSTVDPYNGKCVRASAGSVFHVDVVRAATEDVFAALRGAGLQILAADGYGESDLDDCARSGLLRSPTAWLFGSEAHGLADPVAAAASARVRVPLHGRAESLNLAAAAAVCLYASASAQRGDDPPPA